MTTAKPAAPLAYIVCADGVPDYTAHTLSDARAQRRDLRALGCTSYIVPVAADMADDAFDVLTAASFTRIGCMSEARALRLVAFLTDGVTA